VGMPACRQLDRDTVWEVNVSSVKKLIELSSKEQTIVYPMTNSGYGTKSGEVICTEETSLDPVSLYGESKREAERLLLSFHPNAMTLRLATVFGPSARMRLDLLVNDFVYRAVTEGCLVLFESMFRRNFVHVLDVADGFVHCVKNVDKMRGKPYNLGLDAANMSKLGLAKKIKEHVKDLVIIESDLRSDPDKRDYIVSNQRLREAGFEAQHSLDDGIRGLMRLFKMMPTEALRNA
jgi:nucleoside-diphosphate-sugar epimerase